MLQHITHVGGWVWHHDTRSSRCLFLMFCCPDASWYVLGCAYELASVRRNYVRRCLTHVRLCHCTAGFSQATPLHSSPVTSRVLHPWKCCERSVQWIVSRRIVRFEKNSRILVNSLLEGAQHSCSTLFLAMCFRPWKQPSRRTATYSSIRCY